MKSIGIFAAGLVVGVAGAGYGLYFLLKQKFQQKLETEAQSLRDEYTKELVSLRKELSIKNAAKEENKSDEEGAPSTPIPEEPPVAKEPYIITKEEYDRNEYGYFQEQLMYYADEVVANISDEVVIPEGTIGLEALKTLDEGFNDTIYVRNEALETEWEIGNDPRTYKEVTEYWQSDDVDGEGE